MKKTILITLAIANLLLATENNESQYSFRAESNWDTGKELLYLINKKTNEEKKILEIEDVQAASNTCDFEETVTFTKEGNLIATYACDGLNLSSADNVRYVFSTNGKFIKKMK